MPDIDYKAVLDDLKGRRAALDAAIAAVEGIIGGLAIIYPNSSGEIPIGTSLQSDSFVGLSIADAAAKYLRIVGRPPRAMEDVVEGLNRGGLQCRKDSVSTILRRNNLNDEGEVVRVSRGLWGLREWYPGRPRRSRQNSEDAE